MVAKDGEIVLKKNLKGLKTCLFVAFLCFSDLGLGSELTVCDIIKYRMQSGYFPDPEKTEQKLIITDDLYGQTRQKYVEPSR